MFSEAEKEHALQLFVDMIKFKTISGEAPQTGAYSACAEWLRQQLVSIGLEAWILPESIQSKPIVIALWEGLCKDLPVVLLNSHYDVVPVVEELWTMPSFEGLRTDGRVYGRGTQDMKCVCIEYIAAIKKLKSQNFQPHRTVLLSYVPDEEIGGAEGMNVMLESEWFRSLKIGLALDEGLASEGDDFSVFYGERLPWWIHVTANGNTGHASRFIEGTAVEQVLCVCQKALKFRKEQKDILHGVGTHAGCSHSVATKKKQLGDVTSLNITVLRAGVQSGGSDAVNVVPPSAEAKFDIRVAPSMPTADVAATLDSWCQEVNAETVGLPTGGGVSWKLVGNPLRDHAVTATDATNPWWAVFEGILAGQCGLQLSPSVFPAATDSRFLRALGIRAFGFSPIRRSPILLHEHDEYLEEAVFIEGCEIYVTLIAGLAAQVAFDGDRDTAASTTYGGEEER